MGRSLNKNEKEENLEIDKQFFFRKEQIEVMKEENKDSIFLDEYYDDAINGIDGRTGSIVYDISYLGELELIKMNSRDYDLWIRMNGGVDYYYGEDGINYWKKRFDDLDKFQKRGVFGLKFAPSYIDVKDEPEK